MAICNPCVTGFPTEYIDQLNCNKKTNTRVAGISQLAFLKCDQVLTSLTDNAEWVAIKEDAGNLVRVPSGFGSIPKPNVTKSKLDGCSPDEPTEIVQQINFKTQYFDNTTFTDFDFLCDINGTYSNYTLLILGCDGLMYYSSEWATGENPGFDKLSLFSWLENPESGLQSMNFEIEFKMNDRCIKGIAISDTIKATIFG